MAEAKVVMFDSPEAASYRTDIKGWVSRNGLFYGDNPSSERGARWSGCTHETCDCGNIHEKGRTICDSCYAKQRSEKFYALPLEDWDGVEPVCTWDDDRFFFDEGSLLDWMADLDEGTEVQLVKCKPGYLHLLDSDNWCDDLPEDGELPSDVEQAIENLNAVIKAQGPVCWWPGKVRIDAAPLWEEARKQNEAEQTTKTHCFSEAEPEADPQETHQAETREDGTA